MVKIGNSRYRQLQFGIDHYLLDLDAKKWIWFLPLCIWLFPIKAHRLDKPLEVSQKKQVFQSFPILLAPLLTVILSTLLPRSLFVEKHISNMVAILIILTLSQVLLFLGKYWISQRSEIHGLSEARELTLRYDAFVLKQFRIRIISVFCIFFLIILFTREFVLTGNIIALFCSTAISGFLYSLTNWSEPPGKVTKIYWN